jgi:hypothetical protein
MVAEGWYCHLCGYFGLCSLDGEVCNAPDFECGHARCDHCVVVKLPDEEDKSAIQRGEQHELEIADETLEVTVALGQLSVPRNTKDSVKDSSKFLEDTPHCDVDDGDCKDDPAVSGREDSS